MTPKVVNTTSALIEKLQTLASEQQQQVLNYELTTNRQVAKVAKGKRVEIFTTH